MLLLFKETTTTLQYCNVNMKRLIRCLEWKGMIDHWITQNLMNRVPGTDILQLNYQGQRFRLPG